MTSRIGIGGLSVKLPRDRVNISRLLSDINYSGRVPSGATEKSIFSRTTHGEDIDCVTNAARDALGLGHLSIADIDVIIGVRSGAPSTRYPSLAHSLSERLGGKDTLCFDVSATCNGLLYAITILKGLFSTQPGIRRSLVSCISDTARHVSRNTLSAMPSAAYFADGAGAIVFQCDAKHVPAVEVLDIIFATDGTGHSSHRYGAIDSDGQDTTYELLPNRFLNTDEFRSLERDALRSLLLRAIRKSFGRPENVDFLITLNRSGEFAKRLSLLSEISESKIMTSQDIYGHVGVVDLLLNLASTIKRTTKPISNCLLLSTGFGYSWSVLPILLHSTGPNSHG